MTNLISGVWIIYRWSFHSLFYVWHCGVMNSLYTSHNIPHVNLLYADEACTPFLFLFFFCRKYIWLFWSASPPGTLFLFPVLHSFIILEWYLSVEYIIKSSSRVWNDYVRCFSKTWFDEIMLAPDSITSQLLSHKLCTYLSDVILV